MFDIFKVSSSRIVEADMKVSGKMIIIMVKVRKKDLYLRIYWSQQCFYSWGKWFGNNGVRYEGEY